MRPDLIANPPVRLLRATGIAISILLAVAVLAFVTVGANRPAKPYLVPPAAGAAFPGFGAAYLVVDAAAQAAQAAQPRRLCTVVASTTAQQERGLMGQTSLHGFAGMVFEFGQPTTVLFYMKDTLIPLTVAWFAPDGRFLASADMYPCPRTVATCPTFSAGSAYQLALEVPRGRLASLGIGPGSAVHLGGPCQA